MKKRLILAFCIVILIRSYTNVKVYAATEETITGIGTILDRVDPIEIKTALEIEYNYTNDNVNFREEPNTNSNIIKTLDKRTKVEVVKKISEDWTKVKWDEKVGYIYSKYLNSDEPFTSKKNRWKTDLTEKEIDLLAKIIWTEARGESDEGQIGVTEVIMNRIYSMHYPDTLYGVLSQGDHFSSWDSRNRAEPTEKEYKNIYKVLENKTDLFDFNVVYFSTSPRNKNIAKHIGGHYFCEGGEQD